eukprot:2948257-Prymnesium_polylepis.1
MQPCAVQHRRRSRNRPMRPPSAHGATHLLRPTLGATPSTLQHSCCPNYQVVPQRVAAGQRRAAPRPLPTLAVGHAPPDKLRHALGIWHAPRVRHLSRSRSRAVRRPLPARCDERAPLARHVAVAVAASPGDEWSFGSETRSGAHRLSSCGKQAWRARTTA